MRLYSLKYPLMSHIISSWGPAFLMRETEIEIEVKIKISTPRLMPQQLPQSSLLEPQSSKIRLIPSYVATYLWYTCRLKTTWTTDDCSNIYSLQGCLQARLQGRFQAGRWTTHQTRFSIFYHFVLSTVNFWCVLFSWDSGSITRLVITYSHTHLGSP